MKRSTVFMGLVVCFLSFNVMGGTAEIFHLYENAVKEQFQTLSVLENFVSEHEGVTLSEMKATGNALCVNLIPGDTKGIVGTLTMLKEDPLLGIPGFVWGLCCGFAGVIYVNVTVDDKSNKTGAFWGCVLNSCVAGVTYFSVIGYDLITSDPATKACLPSMF